MANNTESKLKLIHLVYGLFAAAVCIGIAIGGMRTQQSVNTSRIEQKVEKEIFAQHSIAQIRQFDSINVRQQEFSIEQKAMRRDNQIFQKEVLRRLPQ